MARAHGSERRPAGRRAAISAAELRQLLGDIEDHRLAEILELGATRQDVEVALAWAAAESDVMGEERQPLAGRAAAVYDIIGAAEEEEMER